MSVITLQYGQCGNHIGDIFYSLLYDDIVDIKTKNDPYYNQALNKWFNLTKTEKWEPRSILIDTEYKTIAQKKPMPYKFKNIVAKTCGGSANNWAFGYAEQSKLLTNEIFDSVRTEIEKCDFLTSFLNVFSSSGGTGSGVGTKTIELLRDEFPNKSIVNVVVMPYSNGEVIIQSYNSLFTLSKIYSISDATIFFENDRLHYTCQNTLNIKDVNFKDINSLISQQLLGIYQPIGSVHTHHLLAKLCTHPAYKLVQLKTSPVSKLESSMWKSLLSSVSYQSRFDYQQQSQHRMPLKPKNLAMSVICRGNSQPTDAEIKQFKEANPCASWLPKDEAISVHYQPRKLLHYDKCVAVASNTNSVYVPLQLILQDALGLYRYGAYLHHYKNFGVFESDFKEAFDVLESILDSYKKL